VIGLFHARLRNHAILQWLWLQLRLRSHVFFFTALEPALALEPVPTPTYIIVQQFLKINILLHVWVSCGLFRQKVGIMISYFLHLSYILSTSSYILSTYFLPKLHSTYFLQLKKPFLKLGLEPEPAPEP